MMQFALVYVVVELSSLLLFASLVVWCSRELEVVKAEISHVWHK